MKSKKKIVLAYSGGLDTSIILKWLQENFAWMASEKQEKKMIKTMQKGSRIMVTGYNQKGSQTIDHYSLLGFTKAYKAARANCN